MTFTQYNACQEFATHNQNPSCAMQSILDYAQGTQAITNPVAWVNVGFHHLVRDEDQSPMPVHWQGFELVSRDFWAQNPLTPAARDCINGNPGGQIDSTDACGHATTTGLSLSDTSVAGPDTVTATISVSGPGEQQPSGTVSLIDGDALLGTAEVGDAGTVELELPADLAVGEHSLIAAFAPGDGTAWLTSTSEPVLLTVTDPALATSTIKASAPAEVKASARAKVKVRVSTDGGASPTGRVVLRDGQRTVGGARLTGGTATVLLKKLAPGRHVLTVSYAGDDATAASSTTLRLRVVR